MFVCFASSHGLQNVGVIWDVSYEMNSKEKDEL